jgi:hypothetical protein
MSAHLWKSMIPRWTNLSHCKLKSMHFTMKGREKIIEESRWIGENKKYSRGQPAYSRIKIPQLDLTMSMTLKEKRGQDSRWALVSNQDYLALQERIMTRGIDYLVNWKETNQMITLKILFRLARIQGLSSLSHQLENILTLKMITQLFQRRIAPSKIKLLLRKNQTLKLIRMQTLQWQTYMFKKKEVIILRVE